MIQGANGHRSPEHRQQPIDLRSTARIVLVFCCLLAVPTLIAGAVPAGDDPAFSLSRLSVAGKLLGLVTEDLDGDGLKDILIIHRKGLEPDETRWISVFWHRRDGGFSTGADQSWELDSAAVILDTGDVSEESGQEICYLAAGGVFYYALASKQYSTRPIPLFSTRGMAVFPSRRRIPVINFARDWNGDGLDEVAVFKFEGLTIYAADSTGRFTDENRIMVELDTRMSRVAYWTEDDLMSGLSARYLVPDVRLVDYNGDGRKDLVAARQDRVVISLMGEDGHFSAYPDEDVYFDVRTQREKIDANADLSTVVADLNNDNRADAIVTKQTSKGLSSFRGVINIFYAREEGYSTKQDQVIVSEGTASSRTFIRDVNGDGKLDMILPSVKISIASIIRFLITRSLPINFNIFLLNEDNEFPDRPDFTKEVKLKIDLSGESDSQAIDLDGDYNGDMRKDFVFATDEDELSIYLGITGDGDRLFSKKPVAKVNADAFGELSSPDLNGDGYSDMVIYYPQSKERKGLVEVLINQRKIQ